MTSTGANESASLLVGCMWVASLFRIGWLLSRTARGRRMWLLMASYTVACLLITPAFLVMRSDENLAIPLLGVGAVILGLSVLFFSEEWTIFYSKSSGRISRWARNEETRRDMVFILGVFFTVIGLTAIVESLRRLIR